MSVEMNHTSSDQVVTTGPSDGSGASTNVESHVSTRRGAPAAADGDGALRLRS